jgi:putative transposase
VLRSYTLAGKFKVHEFVVMPDHFHVLLSLDGDTSIERAAQLIKGGFSFRRKKELGLAGEIWQRGFSEVRVIDKTSFLAHKEYIDHNPVKAGLAARAEDYPYCSAYLRKKKKPAAEAASSLTSYGTAEARALIRGGLRQQGVVLFLRWTA